MIAILGELTRNLLVILFINVLLEMLLPQGQYHRYIRLVTGLVVMLMVVGAMGSLLGRVPATGALLPRQELLPVMPEPLHGDVSRVSREQALRLYRQALQQLVREEVEAGGQWQLESAVFTLEEDASSDYYGAIYRVELLVRSRAAVPAEVEPVCIDSATAAGEAIENKESPAEEPPARVEALEQALARRLQLSPDQVRVNMN